MGARRSVTEAEKRQQHALERVLAALRRSSGTDFLSFRETTLLRRIQRRMALRGMESIEEYAELVERDDQELVRLFEDILIGVTSFFRNPEVFESLKRCVFPAIIERDAGDGIRMWVPGCSSGEGAYSLAIAMHETLATARAVRSVQMFATDLNEAQVAKARAGVYSDVVASQMSEERLHKYFHKVENGWRVSKPIREMCIFARHDLTSDPPFTRLDLVSCRNLLIYWDRSLQDRLIPLLHYALRAEGFMLLGGAESAERFPRLFAPVDRASQLYQRLESEERSRVRFPAMPSDRLDQEKPVDRSAVNVMVDMAEEIVQAEKPSAAVLFDDRLFAVHSWGRMAPYFRPTAGAASTGLARMIAPELLYEAYSAVQEVGRRRVSVNRAPLRLPGEDPVRLYVVPVEDELRMNYLLMVEPADGGAESAHGPVEMQLEEKLENSEEKLRTALEELAAANEELRTASDELNHLNDDLSAVNEALVARNMRLEWLTSDLENVLTSIDVPLVVLDGEYRVRYSTRAAEWFLGVRPTDVGRSLEDLAVSERFPGMLPLLSEGRGSGAIQEHHIHSSDERSFLIRISPYRLGEDAVAGNVLAFLDVEGVWREAFEESVDMLRALNRLDVIINSTLDTDEIMGLVVDESTSAIAADSAILYRRQGGEWVITHTHGLESHDLRGRRFADGDLPYLTPEPHFEPVVIDDVIADERFDDEFQRKLNRRSVMATQLLVRGEAVGILAFGFAEQVKLNETKVDFGRRLASSVSVALESARTYEQQRTVADQLQESLLKMPTHLRGVRHAAVYRPATQETRVGGDFYDLFELPDEEVAVMIGDISGKGLIAATLTALARGAIRAHAVDGCAPAEVLKKANNTVYHFTGHESFLTAFFGILDTRTGVLRYASGGHPPAMLVGRDGVRALPGTGPLIGAFSEASFEEHSETLCEGEMLVLYTDGITEARSRRGEMYGEEGIVRSLEQAPSRTPDAMLADLIQDALSWADGSLSDDVALLAVKPQLGREAERPGDVT